MAMYLFSRPTPTSALHYMIQMMSFLHTEAVSVGTHLDSIS